MESITYKFLHRKSNPSKRKIIVQLFTKTTTMNKLYVYEMNYTNLEHIDQHHLVWECLIVDKHPHDFQNK